METGEEEKFCDSSRASVGAMVERHYQDIRQFALHLSHSETLAEDLTQEAFAALVAQVRSGKAIRNPRAYLAQTACKVWCDRCIARTAEKKIIEEYEHRDAVVSSPEKAIREKELAHALATALRKLPPNHRAAVVLIVMEDRSYEEASKLLSAPRDTVAMWRRRGLAALRKEFGVGHAGRPPGDWLGGG